MTTPPPAPPARAAGLLALAAALCGLSCERTDSGAAAAGTLPVVTSKTGVEMVLIPAGWFDMGSGRGKPDESPVHRVWVDAFLMDRQEVTQEAYGRLILGNPSHFKGPDRPMEQVSWAKAALYCNARSRAEGLDPCYDEDTAECNCRAGGYRLPTEAEWEYACRAGGEADEWLRGDPRGLRDFAWFAENAAKTTHPVRQKRPNPWGLYDILGNVAEWCNDVYDAGYYKVSPDRNPRGPTDGKRYVLRGGAWNSTRDACRPTYRVGEHPGFQDACFALDAVGFRCVRNAPADAATQDPPPKGPPTDDPPAKDAASKEPAPKAPSAKTGFVYDEVYLRHQTSAGHPERPERLTAIVARLKERGLMARLTPIPAAPAPIEWITTIHSREYVERIRKASEDGTRYLDFGDTSASADSYQAAVTAVGGVMAAVDAVMDGKVRNAFCAVRPPGHHALKDRAMGFCIFNNVAIAARYVQKKHGAAKVLIVDWDVHHGNGTQAAFDADPTVLEFDVHRHPFYPGTGREDETGSGPGAGTKINVPLAAGSGDAQYQAAFEEKLKARALEFRPDFVLISAGFDAHQDDPLGGMKVTAEGYAVLTRIVKALARECCKGRLVSVLEGGYDLKGLADSVEAHLRVLME